MQRAGRCSLRRRVFTPGIWRAFPLVGEFQGTSSHGSIQSSSFFIVYPGWNERYLEPILFHHRRPNMCGKAILRRSEPPSPQFNRKFNLKQRCREMAMSKISKKRSDGATVACTAAIVHVTPLTVIREPDHRARIRRQINYR